MLQISFRLFRLFRLFSIISIIFDYFDYFQILFRLFPAFRLDYFELQDGELYYKGKSMPLTIRRGKIRLVSVIAEILAKEELCDLGFDILRVEEEMPSMSDVAKADDIELQKIMENTRRSIENLIAQLEGDSSEDLPMHELLGLDKQLRSIRGSLKVEVAKRFGWKKESRKKSVSSRKSGTIQNTTMELEKTSEREFPS